MVLLLDPNTHLLHFEDHLGTDILERIVRRNREIALKLPRRFSYLLRLTDGVLWNITCLRRFRIRLCGDAWRSIQFKSIAITCAKENRFRPISGNSVPDVDINHNAGPATRERGAGADVVLLPVFFRDTLSRQSVLGTSLVYNRLNERRLGFGVSKGIIRKLVSPIAFEGRVSGECLGMTPEIVSKQDLVLSS